MTGGYRVTIEKGHNGHEVTKHRGGVTGHNVTGLS